METTSHIKQGHLLFGMLLAFAVGYFVYPQINKKHLMEVSHQMPNGEMMGGQMQHQSMGQMMDSMSANLKGKTGNEFDAAFLEEMIPHHQGAIEMAQMVLATSKRPELIQLANDIVSAQQKEINMMRGWQREWFGVQAQ